MKRIAEPSTRVAVWEIATGHRLERWPVDARAMVATGEYRYDEPPAPVDGDVVTAALLPEGFAGWNKKEMAEYAVAVLGIPITTAMTKAEIAQAVSDHYSTSGVA